MKPVLRRRVPRKPYGLLIGLLASVMGTAIGIVNGIDPFTILTRAVWSGFAVGIIVWVGVGYVRLANRPNEAKTAA